MTDTNTSTSDPSASIDGLILEAIDRVTLGAKALENQVEGRPVLTGLEDADRTAVISSLASGFYSVLEHGGHQGGARGFLAEVNEGLPALRAALGGKP